MSLEQKIEELTAAVVALTAKIAGGVSASAEAKVEKVEKADAKVEKKVEKKATYEPKHTAEEMQAAMNKVRETLGMETAKEIRAANTSAEKISQVVDPKEIDKLYAAATAALEAAEEEGV